jgi:hypothetical protein
MKMPIETVRGTPYEMGLQHGRAYRHVIHGNVHAWALRHTFQGTHAALDAGLKPYRAALLERVRGVPGSGMSKCSGPLGIAAM